MKTTIIKDTITFNMYSSWGNEYSIKDTKIFNICFSATVRKSYFFVIKKLHLKFGYPCFKIDLFIQLFWYIATGFKKVAKEQTDCHD